MSVLSFLAVGLGGALGALCRHKASTFMKLIFKSAFPWPTFFINLCACTIAGAALASSTATNQTFYTALTMGFLGGFSTLWALRMWPRPMRAHWAPQRLDSSRRITFSISFLSIL